MRVRVNAVAARKSSVKAMSGFSKTAVSEESEAPPDTSAISEMSD
jgi:hypothetical protein